jgi:hypothetical protein
VNSSRTLRHRHVNAIVDENTRCAGLGGQATNGLLHYRRELPGRQIFFTNLHPVHANSREPRDLLQ